MIKLISNFQLLHKIYSYLIRKTPVFLVHNNAKYVTIKKALYNLWIDQIEGDFIEFGVFTGSSFRHTIKTEKGLMKASNSKFYGLDSFEGFPESTHPFFKQFDYVGNLQKVKKIEKLDNENIFIIKGYFDKTLETEKLRSIKKIKFAHIDCDLYISAIEPIRFIKERLVLGAYVMIDDFSNVDRDGNSISKVFYEEFKGLEFEKVGFFGVDGVLIRYLQSDS